MRLPAMGPSDRHATDLRVNRCWRDIGRGHRCPRPATEPTGLCDVCKDELRWQQTQEDAA